MAISPVRAMGNVLRLLWRILRPPLALLVHIVLLPVDLLFLVFDAFWVNLRKTGLLGRDCRGRDSFPGGVCPPARKYTNKFLFKLICPEMGLSRGTGRTVCRAGERARIRLVRAASALMLVLFVALAGIIAAHRLLAGRPVEQPQQLVAQIVQGRISRAEDAFKNGRYAEAASLFRSALRLAPGNKELVYRIGLCYAELAEEENAARYFAAAAQGDDAYLPAVRRMAMQLYQRGNVRVAGDYAQRAVDLGLKDGAVLAILADSCLWGKNAEAARSHLQAAEAANPESSVVQVAKAHSLAVQKKYEEAMTILDKVASDPSVALLAGLYKADILRLTGRGDEEMAQVQALADRFPDLAWLSIRALEARLGRARRDEVLREIEELKARLSDKPDAKLDLAMALSRHGYDGPAIQVAKECARDERYRAAADTIIGTIFLRRGMFDEARAYADEALSAKPGHVPALLLAGQAALSADDADAAGIYLNSAVEAAPQDPAVWHALGLLHARVGDVAAAEESLTKARDLAPDDGTIRQHLGMVLMAAGGQARSEAEQLRQQGRDAEADAALKVADAKSEQAKQEFLKAAGLLDRPLTPYTSLGMLARQAGDLEEARRQYLAAIRSDPREAAVAANNLADLMLQKLTGPQEAAVAVALAYSAYVRVVGTPLEGTVADTLAKALRAAGLSAADLGITQLPVPGAGPVEDQKQPANAVPPAPKPPAGLTASGGLPRAETGRSTETVAVGGRTSSVRPVR